MCIYQCKAPFTYRAPCPECLREYKAWMHWCYVMWKRNQAIRIAGHIHRIPPATDQEWQDRLDQVAPIVTPLPEPDFTFTYTI